jgi:hypothetical protein
MSRYERMLFFETIYNLRATYAVRSDADRRGTISIEDVISYAEAVMAAIEAEAEELRAYDELTASQPETTMTGDPRD